MPLQDKEGDPEFQSGWEGFLEEVAPGLGIDTLLGFRGTHVSVFAPQGSSGFWMVMRCVLGSNP